MHVTVIRCRNKSRSETICDAMWKGIKTVGDEPVMVEEEFFQRNSAISDVGVFYGLHGNIKEAWQHYRQEGRKAVYIDLGYWGRREGGRFVGFHKISVNARHPTAYFQKIKHTSNRVDKFGLRITPWHDGEYILLAGMGHKAAEVEGFAPSEWENAAIAKIREFSDRKIIYRPKPSWSGAMPLKNAEFSDPRQKSLEQDLYKCHAVVTHHSNVGVDGILEGVPVFTTKGVAKVLGLSDLSLIETPIYPDGREQWMADVAWTQWNVEEMACGDAWRYLRDEHLV